MKQVTLFFFAAVISMCMGCTTTAKFNFNRTVDFSKMKTYAWVPVSADPEITKEAIDFVKKEVDDELVKKGFASSGENPDFLIAAAMTKKRKLRTSDLAGNTLSPQEIERISYDEGSLILIFLDGKTKANIWWGGVRADLGKTMSPEKKETRAKKAIMKLLKNFPPIAEEQ